MKKYTLSDENIFNEQAFDYQSVVFNGLKIFFCIAIYIHIYMYSICIYIYIYIYISAKIKLLKTL